MIEHDVLVDHPTLGRKEPACVCDRDEEFLWVWFYQLEELWTYASGGQTTGPDGKTGTGVLAELVAVSDEAGTQFRGLEDDD